MPTIIWLPASIIAVMTQEADRFYELETGGTYMGYWATSSEAVVTRNIPAGPEACHGRGHFQPDQAWQITEIERHYQLSGRLDSYMGDWHTHPNATRAFLSRTDRACIRRIIKTPQARQDRPIMLLVTGKPGDWNLSPRICQIRKVLIFYEKIEEENAAIEVYEQPNVASTNSDDIGIKRILR